MNMIWTKWSSKARAIVIAVIALVVLVGVGVFLKLREISSNDSIDTALMSAEEKTNLGDYDQAFQTLKQAEAETKTTEQKLQLLSSLAAAAANAGKISEALGYYAQKHQLDPGSAPGDGYLVGELYERLGDTQNAIAGYELYLGHIKANPPEEIGQGMIDSLETRIQQLKEGQQ